MPVPVFVINLDRSTQRLAAVSATFAQAQLPFTRWPAVDGRALPDPLRLYFADSRTHWPLTPGELGCYASHIAIWEHMLGAGVAVALICEDDIEVSRTFASTLAEVLAAAPPDWEVIKLSSRANRAIHPIAQINFTHALVRYWRVPMHTGAYLITLAGARKLLAFQGVRQAVDGDMARPWLFDDLNVMGVEPPPVTQHSDTSIIGEMGGRAGRRRRRLRFSANRGLRALYNLRALGLLNFARCFLADRARRVAA